MFAAFSLYVSAIDTQISDASETETGDVPNLRSQKVMNRCSSRREVCAMVSLSLSSLDVVDTSFSALLADAVVVVVVVVGWHRLYDSTRLRNSRALFS